MVSRGECEHLIADYDAALQKLETQKNDIQRLIGLLIGKKMPVFKEASIPFMELRELMEQEDDYYRDVIYDALMDGYVAVLQKLETQKNGIQRLIGLLVEKEISVPKDILDRNVSQRENLLWYRKKNTEE